jgi:hypothetical protein
MWAKIVLVGLGSFYRFLVIFVFVAVVLHQQFTKSPFYCLYYKHIVNVDLDKQLKRIEQNLWPINALPLDILWKDQVIDMRNVEKNQKL